MRKFLLSLVFILNYAYHLHGQNQANLNKYWHLRHRLVNQFMAVGPNAGESLPASGRNHNETGFLDWSETPRYVGWYLGVLATEYRLLKNNGQSTDRTLSELYYALRAVIRLDENAEKQWYPSSSGEINGFLMRDDVPLDFLDSHPQLVTGQSPDFITPQSGMTGPVDHISSAYAGFQNDYTKKRAASNDMYSELIMGLALVKKCFDTNVDKGVLNFVDYYYGGMIATNIYSTVEEEVDRMVRYIKNGSNCSLGGTVCNTWVIVDPDGNAIPNEDGGAAYPYAHGIAKAGQYITGTDYTGNGSENIVYYGLWESFQDCYDRVHYNNIRIAMNYASVCDCWKSISGANTTAKSIVFQGDWDHINSCGIMQENHYGFDLFYGAVHRYLHDYGAGDEPSLDLCKMQQILTDAPFDGPYFHCLDWATIITGITCVNKDAAPNGWASSLRFSVNPFPELSQTTGGDAYRGNYNGLDYMLFHNLA